MLNNSVIKHILHSLFWTILWFFLNYLVVCSSICAFLDKTTNQPKSLPIKTNSLFIKTCLCSSPYFACHSKINFRNCPAPISTPLFKTCHKTTQLRLKINHKYPLLISPHSKRLLRFSVMGWITHMLSPSL